LRKGKLNKRLISLRKGETDNFNILKKDSIDQKDQIGILPQMMNKITIKIKRF